MTSASVPRASHAPPPRGAGAQSRPHGVCRETQPGDRPSGSRGQRRLVRTDHRRKVAAMPLDGVVLVSVGLILIPGNDATTWTCTSRQLPAGWIRIGKAPNGAAAYRMPCSWASATTARTTTSESVEERTRAKRGHRRRVMTRADRDDVPATWQPAAHPGLMGRADVLDHKSRHRLHGTAFADRGTVRAVA